MQAVRRPVALDPEKLERVREASLRSIDRDVKRIKGDPVKFNPNWRGPSAKHVVTMTERVSHSQVFSVRKNAYALSRQWDLPFKPAPKRLIRFKATASGVVYRQA